MAEGDKVKEEIEELRQVLQKFVIHYIKCPLCHSPIVVESNEAYQRIKELTKKVFPNE